MIHGLESGSRARSVPAKPPAISNPAQALTAIKYIRDCKFTPFSSLQPVVLITCSTENARPGRPTRHSRTVDRFAKGAILPLLFRVLSYPMRCHTSRRGQIQAKNTMPSKGIKQTTSRSKQETSNRERATHCNKKKNWLNVPCREFGHFCAAKQANSPLFPYDADHAIHPGNTNLKHPTIPSLRLLEDEIISPDE